MTTKRSKSFRKTAAKLLRAIAEEGLLFRRGGHKHAMVFLSKKELTILKVAANILVDKSRQEKALRKRIRELTARKTR